MEKIMIEKPMENVLYEELDSFFDENESGIFINKKNEGGYWSNINQSDNQAMIDSLSHMSTTDCIEKHNPQLKNIIFSPKRTAGLELLDLTGEETCFDYGCMWGALSIPLAKRCRQVLGIDQTYESLFFLQHRIKEENLNNINLLNANIKDIPSFSNKADVAIVNGVLEWVPETGDIELNSYYGQFKKKIYDGNPYDEQLSFLKKVHQNLNPKGKVYLAIENRYDFDCFIGKKDPHNNLYGTSFLPRNLAGMVSRLCLGRPYVNWLYSFKKTADLLRSAGFSSVDLYACFPHYHAPKFIYPYKHFYDHFDKESIYPFRNDNKPITWKGKLRYAMKLLAFKYFRQKQLSPAIIAIGHV